MSTPISLHSVISTKNLSEKFASMFAYYAQRLEQKVADRAQFIARNDELNHHNANPFIAVLFWVALLSFVFFQANTDSAVVTEMLSGDTISDSSWPTFLLGLALCVVLYFLSKGLSLRHGYQTDPLGRRRLTWIWWVSLLGALAYLGFHVYIGLMLLETGGSSGFWAAWLPLFIAIFDLLLGVLYGNIAMLVLQRMWQDRVINKLDRRKRKASQKTSEANSDYKLRLQRYNDSLPLNSVKLPYDESPSVAQAIAFYRNDSGSQSPEPATPLPEPPAPQPKLFKTAIEPVVIEVK